MADSTMKFCMGHVKLNHCSYIALLKVKHILNNFFTFQDQKQVFLHFVITFNSKGHFSVTYTLPQKKHNFNFQIFIVTLDQGQ